MNNNRERGGKLRYVDTTEPQDYVPNFGDINPQNISLTELADAHGSDKGSLKHNYCTQYERLILNFCSAANIEKNQLKINLLEIGVACGASLRTWSHYLPKSKITGLDVRTQCRGLCRDLDNVEIKIADATDHNQINIALEQHHYDLIVDDGSHISEHINTSFQLLWQRVKPGGFYAIEDLSCTYNEKYTSHINNTFNLAVQNKRETTLELIDFILKACDQKKYNISNLAYYPQLLIIQKNN